ncbi:DNA excision repair protein ERCC-3 [Angomonas deanei]|nr:DNA excision repair protein ERCC-3 [Angomonas deanei]|eukprot:EPY32533.1 DNA excision repair protein ERCC-3 [Angomonas deanei]
MRLAKHVTLRSYQVESLERFRRGQKAHQGVVVLPCGAGKTLTGIGAACEIQKRTIILTVNNMSVFQWKREFLKWTNLTEDQVTVCTLNQKDLPGPVFITTYSMLIAKRGEAKGVSAQRSEEILEAVGSTAWGLMILDEVHTAPAKNFQEVLNKVKFNCVLGLSATLLREDGKIDDLRHLVGPKLYEANWLQLTNEGFLAKVQCAEVQCPMPPEFAACYYNALEAATRTIRQKSESTKRGRPPTLGYIASNYASCNPYKLWCTQALLSFHQSRSPPDKVIIFCDFLTEVEYYSKHLNIPYMNRNTSETERRNLLDYFQFTDLNAIILTRVGDVALDLPCATVIIQISGLGASRRQEAQRLGRILRPKPPSLDNTCSYFYTLVSKDTKEVQTSYDRQSWLRDQGFAYRVIQAETVLKEYKRIGGMSCCVGPPRWWYQVLREEEEAAGAEPVQAAQPRKLLLKPKSATAPESRIVTYQSSSWRPFSLEASEEIHRAFQLGKPECLLAGEPFFHEPNDCPGSACRVEFSSVDAPRTFGTAMFTSSDNDTGGSEQRTRRITFGRLEGGHVCDGDCLQHAITRLDRLRGNKTRKEVADLSDPDDEDSSGDDYYDSPGDDFFKASELYIYLMVAELFLWCV